MNIKQAKALRHGDRVHYIGEHECIRKVGPRGGVAIRITEARVSGEVQTWKREPERVRVPLKVGYYGYDSITQDNLHQFHLEGDCPLRQSPATQADQPEPLVEYE